MSPIKEPHHFNTDDPDGIKDRDAYLALFEPATKKHKIIGEASVRYLYSENAVTNILAEHPGSRFLVMLRNPVDMAYAMHQQALFAYIEDIPDFRQAWDMQNARKSGGPLPPNCRHWSHLQYGDYCLLGRQVKRLLSVAPRESCHFIFMEDLAEFPEREWTQLIDFLQVEHDGRKVFPKENSAKNRLFPNLTRPLYFAGKALRARFPHSRPLHRALQAVDNLLRAQRSRPSLSEETRQMLQAYFDDDISLLAGLTGRSLDHWRAPFRRA